MENKITRTTSNSRMASKPVQRSAPLSQKPNVTPSKHEVFPFRRAASKPVNPSTKSDNVSPKLASSTPTISATARTISSSQATLSTNGTSNGSNNIKSNNSKTIKTKTKSKSESPKTKKNYLLIATIALVVVILTVVILLIIFRSDKGDSAAGDNVQIPTEIATTEEENAITKQVMDKYVEITVDGYQRVDNEDGLNDVVVIKIRNISEERTNLALDVVALDNDDKVLDKTSLYAEGIEPGQTQIFEAFALSELTPEQLKSAHYKIYRANTYNLEMPQTENE